MAVVTARTAPAEQTLVDRFLAAVPLLSIFLWLAIVYVIQAWAHKTPWLFGDELQLTQLVPVDRRHRSRGAARRAVLLHHALDLRARARVADRQPPRRVRDRQVPRR